MRDSDSTTGSLDPLFRALGDPRRRRLLDALRDRDGQTLSELERCLPGLTRFGVMRHLRTLEATGLISTRKIGRFKHHYLNPIPIRLIHDRWIRPYQEPLVGALAGLKSHLEDETMDRPRHIYVTYIAASPERVWAALTDADQTRRYWFGAFNRSAWAVGSAWRSESADGELYLDGTIVEVDPPRRLVHTFRVAEGPAAAETPSRLTFELEPAGDACKLTVTHEDLGSATDEYIQGGWETILSGLKTFVETGRELHIGAAA